MVTTAKNTHSKSYADRYWHKGRLVAHISGDQAGQMRLDLELQDFENADHVCKSLKLVIPGESSPLTPVTAVGQNGRFVVSFFSSDIANAGHLPAEAVACWETNERENHMVSVDVVSAAQVQHAQSVEAANVPSAPHGAYPRTVLLIAIGALALALMGIIIVLMQ